MTHYIKVPIENVIIVTSNAGGYLGARCSACGAHGWLDNKYGYPYGTPPSNKLVHKRGCDLGDTLVLHVTVKGKEQ